MKFLVTFHNWGETEVHYFGSERGVNAFLKRNPDLVMEDRQLQILEIKRVCPVSEFRDEAVAA